MPLDWFDLVVAGAIVAISAALQASVGFGFALVAAPTLALIDTRLVPGPILVAGWMLVILMTHRERRSIDTAGLKWAFAGLLPGTLVGALAVAFVPEKEMSLLFGGVVLLAVAMSAYGLYLQPTPHALAGAGALSGVMGTISSMSGPPMALIYQNKPGSCLRGTLSGYFVASTSFSLVALGMVGHFGGDELRLALPLLPGVLMGFIISSYTTSLFDRGYTRPAVLILSAAAALAVILGNIF